MRLIKQSITGLLFLMLFFIVGCSQIEDTSENPPPAFVHAGEQTEEMVLGTYCWANGCVDTLGPVDLLEFENKDPIIVKPEEVVSFEIDYEIEPSETNLELIDGDTATDIPLINNSFTAPAEEGIYYYYYGAWWKDSEDAEVNLGDAFYAFALEVVK